MEICIYVELLKPNDFENKGQVKNSYCGVFMSYANEAICRCSGLNFFKIHCLSHQNVTVKTLIYVTTCVVG